MSKVLNLSARGKGFFLLVAYFLVGYFGLSVFNQQRAWYWDVALPLDHRLPFVPFAIFGYLIVYLSLGLLLVLLREPSDFCRTIMMFRLVMTIHFLFFLFLPVRMELRPDLTTAPGLVSYLARLYFLIDQPTNCFPSLHVGFVTTGTWLVWRPHPDWRIPYLLMTVVTAVSVVLVKQHYIADAVAGVIVASVVCGLVTLWSGRRGRLPIRSR